MKIEANRAEVHTATIEVRTILIDRRQLTLSTFRQIPKHPILNRSTGEFAGELWGTVNYFATADDERPWSENTDPSRLQLVKRHVLFVTDGELRRAVVFEPHWVTLDAADHGGRWRRDRVYCFAELAFGYDKEPPPDATLGRLTDDVKAELQLAWTEIMMLPQLYIAT